MSKSEITKHVDSDIHMARAVRPGRTPSGLLALPYDILYKILILVLPELPPCVRLTLDSPDPPWLQIFSTRKRHWDCAPVVLTCRLLARYSLRIIYGRTRLSVHPRRAFLARLSRLRARRYVQKLDLALELRRHPIHSRKDEICPRHDIASFYSPAYLIDLLHRIFPKLNSITLTLVESTPIPDPPVDGDGEVLHLFPLSTLSQSTNIDPAMFNNVVTSIRYVTSPTFTRRIIPGESPHHATRPSTRPPWILEAQMSLFGCRAQKKEEEDPIEALHRKDPAEVLTIVPSLSPDSYTYRLLPDDKPVFSRREMPRQQYWVCRVGAGPGAGAVRDHDGQRVVWRGWRRD